uniref:Ubiquitin-like domain-containing protein n=2 Tax=Colletotrichum fructicola (strain Nara gc5) TaxID=1213859 RepID=L2FUV4_COLFN
MEFTLAFGAVGDFIAVLELIKNIAAALDDSCGSRKEYRGVAQSLKILESTVRQIEKLCHDQELRGEVRTLALRQVEETRQCLVGFCDKIRKFGPSFANHGTNNVLRDAARKVQWRLEEKEIEKFREELLRHAISMNTLLELTTLFTIRQAHVATIQKISGSEKRTAAIIQDTNQSLMGYLGVIGRQVLSRLEPMSDEDFVFEDATGRVFPIYLRTIMSWEVFEFIIVDRFKGKKGSHRIQKGRYTLQERATGREMDRSLDWESAFSPYQRVSMSLICRDARRTMKWATSASCPKCGTTSPNEAGVEVQCQECNMFFKTVFEPSCKVFRRSKALNDLKANDGTVANHGRKKGRRRNNSMIRILEEDSDSDSDDEDFQGFVRILLISKLAPVGHSARLFEDEAIDVPVDRMLEVLKGLADPEFRGAGLKSAMVPLGKMFSSSEVELKNAPQHSC